VNHTLYRGELRKKIDDNIYKGASVKRKTILMLSVAALMSLHVCHCGAGGDYCAKDLPRNVKGLSVDGPRPKRNVIENMAKIICSWRTGCIESKRTDLEGVTTIKLTVNHVGEIGIEWYTSTVKDSVFVEAMVESLALYDFDPWNDCQDQTTIEFPVVLFP
jgi:hypothetical protein